MTDMTNVLVTKFEASRRLMNAAIRMYFRHDDELATHTVAGAALNLVLDLNKGRREPVQDKLLEIGLRSFLEDYASGKLPTLIRESQFTRDLLGCLSNEVVELLNRGLVPALSFNHNKQSERIWFDKKKTVNFLKHADRDAASSLLASDIDNYDLIKWVVGGYNLLNLPLTSELLIFGCCIFSVEDVYDYKAADPKMLELAERLRKFPLDKRRERCLALLD